MNEDKTNINWYPGHMAKTKNEVKKTMPLIDVVFEHLDARIPYSSKMRDIDDIIKNKFRVLVMTKKDLCDISVTNKWINYYENLGYKVVLTNLSSGDDYKDVLNATSEVINKINNIRNISTLYDLLLIDEKTFLSCSGDIKAWKY